MNENDGLDTHNDSEKGKTTEETYEGYLSVDYRS